MQVDVDDERTEDVEGACGGVADEKKHDEWTC